MIYDIRTFLHGLVEIEMDRIKFHLRSIDGFFSQMFMYSLFSSYLHCRSGYLDEQYLVHFEICF